MAECDYTTCTMTHIHLLKTPTPSDDIKNSFFELEDDVYLKQDYIYRKRRYSTANISKEGLWLWDKSTDAFLQAEKYNPFAGGISRVYPPLLDPVKEYLAKTWAESLSQHLKNVRYRIGVHQIRIECEKNQVGYPAPEGIHQDGFDYVMVTCVNTHNVVGGNSLLVLAKNHEEIVCDHVLNPGESILFCDKTYAHYASPIMPKLPGKAYRDVFVTTFLERDDD